MKWRENKYKLHLNSWIIFITLMSKLSDAGLLLLIIGTLVVVFSLFFSLIILPWVFVYIQIFGWTLYIIAVIFGLLARGEYRVIKLKSGFPLKLDHLIIFICAQILAISFFIFIDIRHFIYTGKFSYFAVSWCLWTFGLAFISYYLKQKSKHSSKNS